VTGRRLLRILATGTAISLLAAGAPAVPARAAPTAYPPGKPPPPPRVRCSISTIVDRRVAISCNAGRARAGKPGAIRIGGKIVARGTVGKDGRYFARFQLRSRLVRGTKILFLVGGKVVATLRA
jgi:hypothetical protein